LVFENMEEQERTVKFSVDCQRKRICTN